MKLARLPGPAVLVPSALAAVLGFSACFLVRQVEVAEVVRSEDSVQVRSPVKAHLLDGATVVYPSGVLVLGGRLSGQGTRYDLTLDNPTQVTDLPLDSVVGLESFRNTVNGPATIALSAGVVGGGILATVAIACAIDPKCFGSCPTYYSDSAGTPVLEAEGFSYSIAPLFESRDVDRLRAVSDSAGMVRLEVRNEAFETHFINHLELLEASHAGHEMVVPDHANRPLAIAGLRPPLAARDRAGRAVGALLAEADGRTYSTDSTRLALVTHGDLDDWIELDFRAPAEGDSLALYLRLRNSLLNTVLLYDLMLGFPGARSLDWQAEELARVGPALELGTWYTARMGLAVEIWRDGDWVPVARLKDTGPVAWKDVTVALPAASGDGIKIRLRFPADNWRIDRVALAVDARRPPVRELPLEGITGLGGEPDSGALAALHAPDARYLETRPGQAFVAAWNAGPGSGARTFMLLSQGYYVEWVRRGWLAAARDTVPFRPGDSTLHRAIVRWREVQDTLERQFFATRVPVR